MSNPNLKDFSISKEEVDEIISFNKKVYKKYLITLYATVFSFIFLIAYFSPTTVENKMTIIAGLIVIFFVLKWFSVFSFALKPFFKYHDKTNNLKLYIDAVKKSHTLK